MNKTPSAEVDSLRALERSVEKLTGRQPSEIRSTTIAEFRRIQEAKGQPLRVVSRFPFVGRGSVLRDRVLSHAQVEEKLDRALR